MVFEIFSCHITQPMTTQMTRQVPDDSTQYEMGLNKMLMLGGTGNCQSRQLKESGQLWFRHSAV